MNPTYYFQVVDNFQVWVRKPCARAGKTSEGEILWEYLRSLHAIFHAMVGCIIYFEMSPAEKCISKQVQGGLEPGVRTTCPKDNPWGSDRGGREGGRGGGEGEDEGGGGRGGLGENFGNDDRWGKSWISGSKTKVLENTRQIPSRKESDILLKKKNTRIRWDKYLRNKAKFVGGRAKFGANNNTKLILYL